MSTPATYRQILLDQLTDCKSAVDSALVAAGLEPLVEWFQDEPQPLLYDNTPYAWLTWGRSGAELGKTVVEHEVGVNVMLMLTRTDQNGLTSLIAAYEPWMVATIEAQTGDYRLLYEGFDPIEVVGSPQGIYAMKFTAQLQRARGGVS